MKLQENDWGLPKLPDFYFSNSREGDFGWFCGEFYVSFFMEIYWNFMYEDMDYFFMYAGWSCIYLHLGWRDGYFILVEMGGGLIDADFAFSAGDCGQMNVHYWKIYAH